MRTSSSFIVALSIIAATGCLLFASACRSSAPPLSPGVKADRILVEKAARRLTLYSNGRALKSYTVALGRRPNGPKLRQGDNRTPEGAYFIDGHNENSAYHRSIHVSYPNARDLERAKATGVSPGGDIMIHGIRNGLGWVGRLHRLIDWTRGCIAVTDEDIEEISRAVPDRTPVDIRP